MSRFWSDYKKVPEKNSENFTQILKKFQRILQIKWSFSKNLRKIRYLHLKILKDFGKIANFWDTFEEIKVFAEIFTKFYTLLGISRKV